MHKQLCNVCREGSVSLISLVEREQDGKGGQTNYCSQMQVGQNPTNTTFNNTKKEGRDRQLQDSVQERKRTPVPMLTCRRGRFLAFCATFAPFCA